VVHLSCGLQGNFSTPQTLIKQLVLYTGTLVRLCCRQHNWLCYSILIFKNISATTRWHFR